MSFLESGTRAIEDDPIDVLLVDDNERWARFIANEIQHQFPRLGVTVAVSANEAIQEILELDQLDCIITDYRMPEVDGLQLMRRVRKERPNLPFILVTGAGSEDIASEAIKAGVTDYLIKDPMADQTTQLANRVISAVTQNRLQESIKESEDRYRTVTEQTRDAIVILENGDIVFANRRFTGLLRGDVEQFKTLGDAVHPEDRDDVTAVIGEWSDGRDESGLHSTRLVTAAGDVRQCEFTGQQIVFQQRPAVLVSIRDVTERERRERELEWERELNRTVQRVVIESKTRSELEAAICRQLCDYGYDLAWTAGGSESGTSPNIVEGDGTAYVTDVTALRADEQEQEPGAWAARTNEPKFIDDFTDLFPTAWQELALESGFRSGAALPLVYDDISYGVMVVYSRQPGRFNPTERELLTALVDTVAYAIHSIETRLALSADRVDEIHLHIGGAEYYLTDILRAPSLSGNDGHVSVDGTTEHDDGRVVQYLSIHGLPFDPFCDRARAHDAVSDLVVVSRDRTPYTLRATVVEPTPELELANLGALIRSGVVRSDGLELTIELPTGRNASKAIDKLKATFSDVSLRSVAGSVATSSSTDGRSPEEMTELTEKQADALWTAYHHGYFERPRVNSAEEVAGILGVSHSTFLQHLRVAQKKLLDALYR